MNILIKIYYTYIAHEKSRWKYFVTYIFKDSKSLEHLHKLEEKHEFSPEQYSNLLQISLTKNLYNLTYYLLEYKLSNYYFPVTIREPRYTKSYIIDNLATGNLFHQDHSAWLALMASHHPYHLLKLDIKYSSEKYRGITLALLSHPIFKPYFLEKSRQELILSKCHEGAYHMFKALFLDVALKASSNKGYLVKI